MAVQKFNYFLQGICDSQALRADQFRDLREVLRPHAPDVPAAGRELLRRGWLTTYQLRQILGGQAHRLVVGPYLLLEPLGRGAMGEVFKARHRHMGRLAAVKVIRTDLANDATFLGRFEREIRAAARLDHPNIIHAYDAGRDGDTLFLAMELVAGADLKSLVGRGGPLPVAHACEYARQAALGLQHAHERGVVHRDVKPSNLLLSSRDSVIKVLDLGLARVLGDVGGLTPRWAVLGTADYLPPEQIRDPRSADARSDLYGLGCTLYFLLTGRPPFAGGAIGRRLLAHLRQQPRGVGERRPDVPAELANLVSYLLAKSPADRPQSAAEVAESLADLLGREPVAPGTLPVPPSRLPR